MWGLLQVPLFPNSRIGKTMGLVPWRQTEEAMSDHTTGNWQPIDKDGAVVSEGTPSEPPVVVREPSGLLKVCINYTSDSGKLITRVQVVKHETLQKVLGILDNEQVL